MQQIGIVKKITDASVKDYTKADGTQSTIKYRSLIVSLFGENIGLDAFGDRLMDSLANVREGQVVMVRFSFNAREFDDRNGVHRISTDLTLREIQILSDAAF
jgi:hypothetical protein